VVTGERREETWEGLKRGVVPPISLNNGATVSSPVKKKKKVITGKAHLNRTERMVDGRSRGL